MSFYVQNTHLSLATPEQRAMLYEIEAFFVIWAECMFKK